MPSSSSSDCDCYYYEFNSIVAFAVLAMLAFMCHSLRRRIPNCLYVVSVPELADVACSLNAMRTHLYQIGRAIDRHRHNPPPPHYDTPTPPTPPTTTTTTTTNDDGDARCEVCCCRIIKKKGE
jgi:hypothetical protein